jgi:hypothetical protein
MLAGYRARFVAVILIVIAIGAAPPARSARGEEPPRVRIFATHNESGMAWTMNVAGFPVVATDNPFFLDLGINGRRCSTCHEPETNMTVTPRRLQARFDATDGNDPIFRLVDGSNSPLADTSTVEARRAAYSMLLTKGLIRVGLPIPATAEFELASVHDPYGYAGDNATGNELSLFRRPLPTTNLGFLSTVMWDGRETIQKGTAAAIHFDLAHQANTATEGHAERPTPIDAATRERIVAYQLGLYTAQVLDNAAGTLFAAGGLGGPRVLSGRAFVFGVNDPLGCDPAGENCTGSNPDFTPIVFTEYAAWQGVRHGSRHAARAAVARGQGLFNTLAIPIKAVAGINDDFAGPGQFDVPILGTCTTCHDTPHAGNHSVPAPLDIGIAAPPVPPAEGGDGVHNRFGLPVGDMPVYTLRHKATGELKIVTDPGRALVTGRWKDVGRFKGPILRGLAGRGPYGHNGAAATRLDVVNVYDRRFELKLTEQQKADLVAFLRAL